MRNQWRLTFPSRNGRLLPRKQARRAIRARSTEPRTAAVPQGQPMVRNVSIQSQALEEASQCPAWLSGQRYRNVQGART
ncbi:hypothetical protein MRX96_021402 [Rhipicephalus microplus]